MFSKKAFTIIEILVVIAIFMAVIFMTFYFFSKINKKEALEKDISGLTALIRNARLLSVTSKNSSAFGIHLENDRAVLFEGSSYTPGGPNEKVIVFSSEVYMQSYVLNLALPDIVFSRLLGDTPNYGTITLSLKDNTASTTITILETGVIQ